MTSRTKAITGGIVVTLAILLGLGVNLSHAQSVYTNNLFELDGNAIQDSGSPNSPGSPDPLDDWERLYYDQKNNTHNGAYTLSTGILTPGTTPGVPIVQFSGGSKDIYDYLSTSKNALGWKSGLNGIPDKDRILDAYAANYIDPATKDQIIYFGADRYADNGDAYLGFWFFKSPVSIKDDGTFNGQHTPGDILVLVDFPQCSNPNCGPLIQVIEWDPTITKNDPQYAATNLRLLSSGTASVGSALVCNTDQTACAITNIGANACPISNTGSFPPCTASDNPEAASPWSYTPKSGTSGFFPYESFFEGGINITKLVGASECFASFLAETRTSESFTASLEQFVIHKFNTCSIDVTKTCGNLGASTTDPTDPHLYGTVNITVTNDGSSTIPSDATVIITDTVTGQVGDVTISPTSSNVSGSGGSSPATFTLSSDLPVNGTITFTAAYETSSNPPEDTVTADVILSDGSTLEDTDTVTCTPVLNSSIQINKYCEGVLLVAGKTVGGDDAIVLQVDYSGLVTYPAQDADGNLNTVPLQVKVWDVPDGTTPPGPDTPGNVLLLAPNSNDTSTAAYTQILQPGDTAKIPQQSYIPTEPQIDTTIATLPACPVNAKFHDKLIVVGHNATISPDVSDFSDAYCPICGTDNLCN